MLITCATHHRWSKPTSEGLMKCFGKKSQGKLRATLKGTLQYDIKTWVEPVSEEFLDWFLPMYEGRIESKSNPNVIPIRERVAKAKRPYYALILSEHGVNLGATIFSVTETDFSIAWRTYENDWKTAKLAANPSIYMEYISEELAIRYNCENLVHGKDTNPYGLHSSIGLAAFKLKVGVKPSIAKKYDMQTIDTESLKNDAIIFEYTKDNETEIKKGYLVTSRETEHKWSQVTKYPHLIEVETIYRD